jgi:hypothetical protein
VVTNPLARMRWRQIWWIMTSSFPASGSVRIEMPICCVKLQLQFGRLWRAPAFAVAASSRRGRGSESESNHCIIATPISATRRRHLGHGAPDSGERNRLDNRASSQAARGWCPARLSDHCRRISQRRLDAYSALISPLSWLMRRRDDNITRLSWASHRRTEHRVRMSVIRRIRASDVAARRPCRRHAAAVIAMAGDRWCRGRWSLCWRASRNIAATTRPFAASPAVPSNRRRGLCCWVYGSNPA